MKNYQNFDSQSNLFKIIIQSMQSSIVRFKIEVTGVFCWNALVIAVHLKLQRRKFSQTDQSDARFNNMPEMTSRQRLTLPKITSGNISLKNIRVFTTSFRVHIRFNLPSFNKNHIKAIDILENSINQNLYKRFEEFLFS